MHRIINKIYKRILSVIKYQRRFINRRIMASSHNRKSNSNDINPMINSSRSSNNYHNVNRNVFNAPLVLKDNHSTKGIESGASSLTSKSSQFQSKANIVERTKHKKNSDPITEFSDEEECNLIDCNDVNCLTSPSKWISDFAKDCSGFNGEVDFADARKMNDNWREKAATAILNDDQSDDYGENDGDYGDDNSDYGLTNKKAIAAHRIDTEKKNERPMQISNKETNRDLPLSNNTVSTLGSKSTLMSSKSDIPVNQEPRIVAPNVEKLSPTSVVEIRLLSLTECVAVLCSVDVLKMRSGFFHQVLIDQEKNVNNSNTRANTATTHTSVSRDSQSTNGIWRDPITVPENSPFEAAAFLESLHEGRAPFKGDWNFSWTRLSVTWKIDDLIAEYANLIEMHVNRLLTLIHDNHWRTNPDTLIGYRIAVFRKSSSPTPSILLGTVVESTASTGYSKVRVMFDVDKNSPSSNFSALGLVSPAPQIYGNSTPLQRRIEEQIVGDVFEPFWVQSKLEGSLWVEPDEVYANECKRHISILDKRIFWEMSRAILDHSELASKCKSGIRNARDLATVLKRPENRVLWIPEAPDLLPKEAASEIISFSYIKNFEYSQEK